MSDFLQNKYTKWYFAIITNAKSRNLLTRSDAKKVLGYPELHHIIPKCLGGDDHQENTVFLTAHEHFVCHRLLTKMVNETKQKYQMWNAFSCMLYREVPGMSRYKITGRVFENIKKEGAKIKSIKFSGENNPMYGVRGEDHPSYGIKWTNEMRKKASISHKGHIRSVESRKKQSEKTKGRKQSAEHIAKRIQPGKIHSTESKEKIRQAILNMPSHTCEHCGKITTKGNYKRWHSNNCKVVKGELKFHA